MCVRKVYKKFSSKAKKSSYVDIFDFTTQVLGASPMKKKEWNLGSDETKHCDSTELHLFLKIL